jgi:hypothetical protein
VPNLLRNISKWGTFVCVSILFLSDAAYICASILKLLLSVRNIQSVGEYLIFFPLFTSVIFVLNFLKNGEFIQYVRAMRAYC